MNIKNIASHTVNPGDLSPASTAVASSLSAKRAATATTTGTASTGATAAQNVTSNDFLTLLVTELKNQDPTQPTDPNSYVQQLTEVNSLQQLIAINQDLSGSKAGKPTGASTSTNAVNS